MRCCPRARCSTLDEHARWEHRPGPTTPRRRVGPMENITMTIDATHMSRVRSGCPEAAHVVLAGTRGPVAQGTAVSAPVAFRVIADAQLPMFYVDGFGAGNGTTTTKDLAFRPFREPPV